MLSSIPVGALATRSRVVIPGCIALVTILAWAWLIHLGRQMSAGIEDARMMAAMGMSVDHAWTAADLFLTFAMWTVMMIGMMAPSASPMLMLFARSRAGKNERGVSAATLAFALGYFTVWTGFSLLAALAQWGLHQAALLSAAMASSSNRLSGIVLIAAGAYQLTPWKGRCLTHCRSPLGFLIGNWRDGASGAFRMGFRHGVYCLGCCWSLMCVLFVAGVMNLLWVAALTVFVLVEKIGPAGPAVARIAGAALLILGVAVMA